MLVLTEPFHSDDLAVSVLRSILRNMGTRQNAPPFQKGGNIPYLCTFRFLYQNVLHQPRSLLPTSIIQLDASVISNYNTQSQHERGRKGMLNLQIEIRGDLDDTTRIQARGVVAALVAVFGPAVLPNDRTLSVTQSLGAASITTIGDADVVKAATAYAAEAPASDGYPTTEEPSAAQAFGGNAPTTATTLPTGERDSEGIPWDERIHASTKTTNKDGTWTRRRNTPDATFDAVMAELKAANTQRTLDAAAAMTTAPAVATPVPPTPSVPAPPTSAASPAPSPVPAVPAASSSAPAVPAPPTASTPAVGAPEGYEAVTTFPQIMMKVTKAQAAAAAAGNGPAFGDAIKNLLMSVGAQPDANGNYGIIALNKQPDLIPAFDMLLEDFIK